MGGKMGLTKKEIENYQKFCKFSDKDVIVDLFNGKQFIGNLCDFENPIDVEPEYPMFIIKETPDSQYLVGIYLNEIKDMRLT